MSDIRIVAVDERDGGWEDDRPRFRVYLHTSGETSTLGSTATYDVTSADVLQVIDWAQRQVGEDQVYAVALVRDEPRRDPSGTGRGLVWLVGRDGNDDARRDVRLADAQERMLQRRRAPVVVPASDAMPPGAVTPSPDLTHLPPS